MHLLAVGLGGFVGAVARYGISGWMHRLSGGLFPIGTLTVNVLGCFLIGLFMTLVQTREWLEPNQRLLLITGILGSLTTFSTFGYETLELLRYGHHKLLVMSVIGNVVLGLAGVFLGRLTATLLAS